MRKLIQYPHRYTTVSAIDEPAIPCMANHHYHVEAISQNVTIHLESISFQDGPIKEKSANGIMDENLIAIVIDRLQGFQKGPYSCRENAIALTKLEEAMMWLNARTDRRTAEGKEGTSQI